MSRNCTIFELGVDYVPDQVSADANSDLAGDWISLENYDRAYYLLQKPAGTAGDDLSIDLNQATDNAGTSTKALEFTKVWHKIGTLTGVGQWTAVELTTASSDLDLVSVNSVDLATDTSAACIMVEIMADSLDINNDFNHVQVLIEGDDIANSLIVTSGYLMCGARYPQATPLSVL